MLKEEFTGKSKTPKKETVTYTAKVSKPAVHQVHHEKPATKIIAPAKSSSNNDEWKSF